MIQSITTREKRDGEEMTETGEEKWEEDDDNTTTTVMF